VDRQTFVDTVPVHNCLIKGDFLLLLLFNFPLECAFRKVQTNAGNVNLLGQTYLPLKTSRELLLVSSKELGPEVNADKTMYFTNRMQDKITT
jgi:hypothetical protein